MGRLAEVLQKYLNTEQKELQALYALQALMVELEQPASEWLTTSSSCVHTGCMYIQYLHTLCTYILYVLYVQYGCMSMMVPTALLMIPGRRDPNSAQLLSSLLIKSSLALWGARVRGNKGSWVIRCQGLYRVRGYTGSGVIRGHG